MTTITLPRAVVEQALEALERNTSQDMSVVQGNALARQALRAALAQHSPATLIDPRGSLGEPIV